VPGGATVIDLRPPEAFGEAHVPGALGIGAGPNLATWAAWVVPAERPLLLVAEHPELAHAARRALCRVGLDAVDGYLDGGFAAWRSAGLAVRATRQVAPRELQALLASGAVAGVLDVRNESEWRAGHIDGAANVMGGLLAQRLGEVPRGGPLALVCASGYRSTVAASVLERAGFEALLNLAGGMNAWQHAGLPVTR
jgi:hydroxyacylglutathione hydrolase